MSEWLIATYGTEHRPLKKGLLQPTSGPPLLQSLFFLFLVGMSGSVVLSLLTPHRPPGFIGVDYPVFCLLIAWIIVRYSPNQCVIRFIRWKPVNIALFLIDTLRRAFNTSSDVRAALMAGDDYRHMLLGVFYGAVGAVTPSVVQASCFKITGLGTLKTNSSELLYPTWRSRVAIACSALYVLVLFVISLFSEHADWTVFVDNYHNHAKWGVVAIFQTAQLIALIPHTPTFEIQSR